MIIVNGWWLKWCPSWLSLTPPISQREVWFQVTPWIAEFWCCLSNVGFLWVAYRHKEFGIAFAGIASILSHAIPWEPLLWIDKIGVVIAIGSIVFRFSRQKSPSVRKKTERRSKIKKLAYSACLLLGMNFIDMYLSRNQRNLRPYPHVIWHCGAAFLSHLVLKELKEDIRIDEK